MNTTVPFNLLRPELTLKRRDPSSSQSVTPFENPVPFPGESMSSDPYGHSALQAAWDKLYRARSLLEAEQAHLRDDRIAIQGALDELHRRDEAVSARELRMQQAELSATLDREEAQDERDSRSAIARFTQAPFDMARSVFGGKK